MELLIRGITEAFKMIVDGDPEILRVTLLTLRISGLATMLSVLVGIPVGMYLAVRNFWGRKFLISIFNTGMGMPPTVAGLWVTIFLWRYGPLGFLDMMYTPMAIMIAQFVIACPMVIAFSVASIQNIRPGIHEQIKALGATRFQYFYLLVREARLSLIAAVIAGFGAVISEVGASMMVGGNIKGYTRVLTTATVMEVSKGHFEIAIALGTILLLLAYSITLLLTLIQQKEAIR